jgi:hypothetical protein
MKSNKNIGKPKHGEEILNILNLRNKSFELQEKKYESRKSLIPQEHVFSKFMNLFPKFLIYYFLTYNI